PVDSVRARVLRVFADARPPYSGAEWIVVTMGSTGKVQSIQIVYPEDVTFDVLLDRLIRDLGEPTTEPLARPRMAIWSSRTEALSLSFGLAERSRATIQMRLHTRQ